MSKQKHTGAEWQDCSLCKATNERSIVDVGDLGKRHRAALRRSERDQAMRDLGLVKVRGALGGVYYE
jgi:hypothetical protein